MAIRPHLKQYRRDSYLAEPPTNDLTSTRGPIIDCSLGYNPLGFSKRAEEAIKGADLSSVAAYPEMFYSRSLKPAILARYAESGLREDNIFLGHGSFNIAERLIHKLIEPTFMLGYGPQFNEIPSEMVAAGGTYHPVPMTSDFHFPKDALIRHLQEGSFSVAYIDNPNNPTGQLIEMADLAGVIEAAERVGTTVIVDEAYGDFVDDCHSCFNIVVQHSNLVVIRSFSKGLGLAGLRVGYAGMSDSLALVYQQLDVPFEPCWLGALAAKATLEDVDFLNRTRQVIQGVKRILTSGLQNVGVAILPTHPRVSIFVAHIPNRNLHQLLAAQGVLTEAGSLYRQTYEPFDDSYVRVRVPATGDVASEIVDRVSRGLKGVPTGI